MKTFRCRCGNTLFFENDTCLQCGCNLGFIPAQHTLLAIEPLANGHWRALGAEGEWKQCANFSEEHICN